VKDALKQNLLGVLFNMVPESRLGLVTDQYTRFLQERRDQLRRPRLQQRLSAVSVEEIVGRLRGTLT